MLVRYIYFKSRAVDQCIFQYSLLCCVVCKESARPATCLVLATKGAAISTLHSETLVNAETQAYRLYKFYTEANNMCRPMPTVPF